MEAIVNVKMRLSDYERVRKAVKQYESRIKAAREHARRKYQYSDIRNNEHKSIKMITTGMGMGSFEELMNQQTQTPTCSQCQQTQVPTCSQCQQTQAPTSPHAEEGSIINQSGPL
jgi:molybdenum cofactor biosynthesis enzyme MoaA